MLAASSFIHAGYKLAPAEVIDERRQKISDSYNVEVVDTLTNEEIELVALVAMAEAEGECEEGQRLVIDTVLNRMEDSRFPDTIEDVIFQPNQFTSMHNGRSERCDTESKLYFTLCRMVKEEYYDRTNSEVIFFTSVGYSAYGTPLFKIGNHYFSKY